MSSDMAVADSDLIVDARNVGKCYHVYERPSHRLLQGIVGNAKRYYNEFWALRGADLHIAPGETVGLIGRNGSGKSTFLQMIAGTLAPTEGSVEVRGRVAALLELGSGFNPDFTGRENVYLNGAILGLTTEEIDASLDRILAFADIGAFIEQPVRNYSSGMAVRLAFAVQAQVNPQLLIVDEALSVGDAKFQAKCFARLKQLREDGASILFVSHSADQIVQHCDRALLIDAGTVRMTDRPKHVVNAYYDLLFGTSSGEGVENGSAEPSLVEGAEENVSFAPAFSSSDSCAVFEQRANYNPHEFRWGDAAARIVDFDLSTTTGAYPAVVESGSELRLALRIRFDREVFRPILGVTIKTAEGVTVYGCNSEYQPFPGWERAGAAGSVVDVAAVFRAGLADGDYFISVGVASRGEEDVVPHDRRYDSIHFKIMQAKFFGLGDLDMRLTLEQAG